MSTRKQKTRTPDEFRAWLHANGITLTAWSEAHGFHRQTASDLLRGNRQGLYGEAHKCAVAMGLKPDPQAGDKGDKRDAA